MLAKHGGAKSLILNSNKRTVANTVSKSGVETIKSRHAVPLDIDTLIQDQLEYSYTDSPNKNRDVAKAYQTEFAVRKST